MNLFLKKVLDFYVYSSIHISLCAMGMTWYAYQLFDLPVELEYVFFIGSSTWLLYSIHRIIGIEKVGAFKGKGRFAIIRSHKAHIYVYAVLAAGLSGYYFFRLRYDVIYTMVIPALVSLFYVSPLFPGKKRLRDLSWTKILMIAMCWSWLTTFIPGQSTGDALIWGLARFFFLFGITIPFDLRDKDIDAHTDVKTIAHFASANVLSAAAIISLVISLFLPIIVFSLSAQIIVSEVIVHLLAIGLVWYTIKDRHDYAYSLLLDGSMGAFYIVYIIIGFLK
ncbi:MAG: hypothetical protein HKN68_20150 [Saprospiraceae bacterium]|nr:hypothetical protein [Saprospiraceae bacterium]